MITEIFGENCKRVKVIDLLLSHPNTEYTKYDLSECAEISRGTLDTFIDELEEIGIVKTTSIIGNSKFYQINMGSPITQALNSFQNQLADIEIEKQLAEYEKTHNIEIDIKRPFEKMAFKNKQLLFESYDTKMWSTTLEKQDETLGKLTKLISQCDQILYHLERTNFDRNISSFSMGISMQQNETLSCSY